MFSLCQFLSFTLFFFHSSSSSSSFIPFLVSCVFSHRLSFSLLIFSCFSLFFVTFPVGLSFLFTFILSQFLSSTLFFLLLLFFFYNFSCRCVMRFPFVSVSPLLSSPLPYPSEAAQRFFNTFHFLKTIQVNHRSSY